MTGSAGASIGLVDALRRYRESMVEADATREDLAQAIREAVESGMSQADVARILGWPRQRVGKFLNG